MKKILTILLSGFGMREETYGNAIKTAGMNNFVKLWNEYPHSLLKASEKAVGLLKGQPGNSEESHTTIGAGRLLKQNITQVDELLSINKLKTNTMYKDMIDYLKENNKTIHLLMLASDSGIHSYNKNMIKMLEALNEDGIENISIHLITDGKDDDQTSSWKYINEIQSELKDIKKGKIVSVIGRYYALDKDNDWEKTKVYYDLITKGTGIYCTNIKDSLKLCYQKGIYDDKIPPLILDQTKLIKKDDVVLWMNCKPDYSKQILKALSDKDFEYFNINKFLSINLYSLFDIDKKINSKSLLEEMPINNTLGEYLSALGLSQARISEENKFLYINYYFDGKRKLNLENCDKFSIPNKKESIIEHPEMNAVEVTKKVIKCMEDDYDFILVNYTNAETLARTNDYLATEKALQAIDICLSKLVDEAEENFYTMIILGDHGQAEYMYDKENKAVNGNTLSSVPFIICDKKVSLANGDLTMVAPTILKYMDISLPSEMKSTENLFQEED